MIAKNEIGGLLPGPADPKDWHFFPARLPGLRLPPGDIDLIGRAGDRMTDVSDQLWLNSCVANATADSIELLNALEGKDVVQVSRLQIYYDGRSVMSLDGVYNETTRDEGMYIRAAYHAMATFGICPESAWPYVPKNVNVRPDLKAIWQALKNKLKAYYRITSSREDMLDDILSALRAGHPPVFGIPVTDAFHSGSGKTIPPPKNGEVTYGLHAIMAVGCVGDKIRIRNSWGKNWGDGGYALMDPGWFEGGHALDAWVATNGMVIK